MYFVCQYIKKGWRKPKVKSRMNNPEKLAILRTQDTARRQTKQKTQYVLDTIIHKTEDEDKQQQKHNTIYV
jgi:hypothetical protein